jgi:hypothetical protein
MTQAVEPIYIEKKYALMKMASCAKNIIHVCKPDSGLAHFSLPNSLVYWTKWRVILRPCPCTWPLHTVLRKGLEALLARMRTAMTTPIILPAARSILARQNWPSS